MVHLLLAMLPTGARCQTLYGFSLDPGENANQLVTPTTNLTLNLYWTEPGPVNISGLIDGSTDVTLTSGPNEMTSTSQGVAVITISGDTLSLGR